MKFTEIVKFAEEKHKGQTDKGGAPYIGHPKRVADMIWDMFNDIDPDGDLDYKPFDYMKVAILHDIIEDTDTTPNDLFALGLSEELINGVLSVTRQKDESYSDFIKRASQNKYGKVVKYFDLTDNLDITRLHKLSYEDINRLNKYLKAYYFLQKCMQKEFSPE